MGIFIENKDQLNDILYGDGDWSVVEEGDWTQDYKYQHQTNIVKHLPTGDHYRYEISRSGSPFTDWYYSYEDGDYPHLFKVELKERTIVVKEWVSA